MTYHLARTYQYVKEVRIRHPFLIFLNTPVYWRVMKQIVTINFHIQSECEKIENRKVWYSERLMMMNCFCGMVDRRKAFSLISNRYHCLDQRSSSSRISDTPQAGFEPELRLYWMKLCSSDNHYTTAPPPNRGTIIFFISNWFTHHCHKLVLTQCSSYFKFDAM